MQMANNKLVTELNLFIQLSSACGLTECDIQSPNVDSEPKGTPKCFIMMAADVKAIFYVL